MPRDAAISSAPLAKVVENRQTKPLKAASIAAGSASLHVAEAFQHHDVATIKFHSVAHLNVMSRKLKAKVFGTRGIILSFMLTIENAFTVRLVMLGARRIICQYTGKFPNPELAMAHSHTFVGPA
jgi:hypothetical protein